MKKPTKRQLEVLKVLNPYLDKVTYSDAARILKTSEDNIKHIMMRLSKRCPEIYDNYISVKKILNGGQKRIRNAIVTDPERLTNLEVKEKF